MKFKCPYCTKEIDLMELQLETDLHAIIKLQPTFGQQAHIVMGYCYLFGISPLKIKAKKLRILLEELKRLFDAESFKYDKNTYYISRAGIAEALDIVIKRNFTSTLKNHNYLKEVMVSISEKERTTKSRQDEKELRKKEEKLRTGNRPEDQSMQGEEESRQMPPELKQQVDKFLKR